MTEPTVNGVHALLSLFGAIGFGLFLAWRGDRRTRRALKAKADADRRFLEGRTL